MSVRRLQINASSEGKNLVTVDLSKDQSDLSSAELSKKTSKIGNVTEPSFETPYLDPVAVKSKVDYPRKISNIKQMLGSSAMKQTEKEEDYLNQLDEDEEDSSSPTLKIV